MNSMQEYCNFSFDCSFQIERSLSMLASFQQLFFDQQLIAFLPGVYLMQYSRYTASSASKFNSGSQLNPIKVIHSSIKISIKQSFSLQARYQTEFIKIAQKQELNNFTLLGNSSCLSPLVLRRKGDMQRQFYHEHVV